MRLFLGLLLVFAFPPLEAADLSVTGVHSEAEVLPELLEAANSPSLLARRWTSTDPNPFNSLGLLTDPVTGARFATVTDRYVGWLAFISENGTLVITTCVTADGVVAAAAPPGGTSPCPAGATLLDEISLELLASCLYVNGTLYTCGFSAYELQRTFPVRCNLGVVGAWSIDSIWDPGSLGAPQPLHHIPFEMRGPEKAIQLFLSSSAIPPLIPPESDLPPGFATPGSAAGTATLTAKVIALGCPGGVPDLPVAIRFETVPGTGWTPRGQPSDAVRPRHGRAHHIRCYLRSDDRDPSRAHGCQRVAHGERDGRRDLRPHDPYGLPGRRPASDCSSLGSRSLVGDLRPA